MESKSEDSCSVGVAVRVRPLSNKELMEGSKVIIKVDERLKLITIEDRPFTFDQVFGLDCTQEQIFKGCAENLVHTVFKGYNATILAYGQTGSGKTFTMGSAQVVNLDPVDVGIIPRVISMIFDEAEARKPLGEFVIKINFIEIYNEEIHDLLNKAGLNGEKHLAIRERAGSIVIDGLSEELVTDASATLNCLEEGTMQRSVSSTLMNSQSSRSHAIFTINIDFQGKEVEGEPAEKWTTKFHFVDLAGSERAKRTGASGATLKEGISINKGLLCLGNVISALTEDSKKSAHIPYRDSKLTRILQDSLGGNANTFMIACASPAESNFEETLNTLKYASRARNIKNKPVVNTDPHSAMIAALKLEIAGLKAEVLNYQNVLESSGREDLASALEELKRNSVVRTAPNEELAQHKSQQMEKKVAMISTELDMARSAFSTLEIENLKLKRERDLMKIRLDSCIDKLNVHGLAIPEEDEQSVKLVDEYLDTIEKLKKEKESQSIMIKELEYEYSSLMKEVERDRKLLMSKNSEIEQLRMRKTQGNESISSCFDSNLEEYSRMFAETVMATMTSQDTSEIETELPSEVIEQLEIHEQQINLQKEEITQFEDKIKEKEEKMKNIEGAFREIQNKILDEMNNQYYLKIEQIKSDLKSIERERDLAIEKVKGSGEQKATADKYKSKIQELENQLHENIRKDKQLQSLQKELESQKSKLTKMNEEIKKEKKQKVELQTKLKKEKEEFIKIKTIRAKELITLKKTSAKKDQTIKVLQAENRKKEIIAKRKTEELAAVQKRQRDIALKRKSSGLLTTDILRQWVKDYAKACIEEQSLSRVLSVEENEKTELEQELQEMYESYSLIKTQLDNNELILTDHEPNVDLDELYSKIQSGRAEVQEILDSIEIIEEKLAFKQNKIIDLSTQMVNSRVEEIKSKASNMSSIENSQNLINVLFEEILSKSSKKKQLKEALNIKEAHVADLRDTIQQVSNEKEAIRKSFENEIRALHQELTEKKDYIFKILDEGAKIEQETTELEELTEENKKYKERLDYYVNRYNKLLKAYKDVKDSEYDKSKPRSSIIISNSLTAARDRKKKQKLSINDEDEKIATPRISAAIKSTASLKAGDEEVVFDRLQRPLIRSRTSIQPDYCPKPKQKWEQVKVTEAHEGSITALMITESMMFTGSNQKLKIWNLETFEYIGEVTAHTGFIKNLCYFEEQKTFFTSCGNLVNYYDSCTLTKINSIRGHIDEIRAMKVFENYLICAGKASPHSITFWDLRKLDSPVSEKEKALDVFSFLPADGVFYYGCRDHKVHRMRICDLEVMKSFENSHYDTVTCLGLYENLMISGSRDKNLRIWDYESGIEIKSIINAHTDWVNCIETDSFGRVFYTGGKEGKIKVWQGTGNDINLSGEVSGHSGSVNCLCSVPAERKTLVSVSADKSFRVWKLEEEFAFGFDD